MLVAHTTLVETKFRASDVDIISTQILTKYHPALLEDSAPLQTIIKNKYFKNIVTYYISYWDWFSAIAFGFR